MAAVAGVDALRPFFPFYGSKWRDARRYTPPSQYVIEPFAGSAGYSVWHEPKAVLLIDRDEAVVGVWQYLIHATPEEVLRLPDLQPGQSTDDLVLPQEARWLIGFWLNRGSAVPKKTQTAFSRRTERQQLVWGEKARTRIATQVGGIRHWKVQQGDYKDAPADALATWFVDPPYVDKGRYYRHHAMDYKELAEWCLWRSGRVIVCEQEGATWLPFQPLASIKSLHGRSVEVVYEEGGV